MLFLSASLHQDWPTHASELLQIHNQQEHLQRQHSYHPKVSMTVTNTCIFWHFVYQQPRWGPFSSLTTLVTAFFLCMVSANRRLTTSHHCSVLTSNSTFQLELDRFQLVKSFHVDRLTIYPCIHLSYLLRKYTEFSTPPTFGGTV